MVIRTLGHGTLAQEDFLALCRTAGLDAVVDVRRYPGSRRHPQFGREAMAGWLAEAGMGYTWLPDLGGRRTPSPDSPNVGLRNPQFRGYADHMAGEEFRRGCAELVTLARSASVAVLCAESVWWRCHRRLLADHLVLVSAVAVEHILPDARIDPHRPTPGARREGDHVVYDVGAQPKLVE
ncbi:MAG: DUF488 domain-containing protein [Actinomycetota bacterium]|nr:DUF488 domain-containing protein [Actinomycetota bacterium]